MGLALTKIDDLMSEHSRKLRLVQNEQEQEPTPSQEIAGILGVFGEEFGFDAETVEEIAELEFEEAFETAYSYLTQAGIDADEVLTLFLEEPDTNP